MVDVYQIRRDDYFITVGFSAEQFDDADRMTSSVYLSESLAEMGEWSSLQLYLSTNVVASILLHRLGTSNQKQHFNQWILDPQTKVALCVHEDL